MRVCGERGLVSKLFTHTRTLHVSPIQIVLHDPACYSTDIQIVVDCLVGNGVITERSPTPPRPTHPPIFFSNADVLYPNLHPVPRLGQGAFLAAVGAVYRAVTGHGLSETGVVRYGKPERAPYDLARSRLTAQAARHNLPPATTIYIVGDNPAADIAGAHAHGFDGLLVLTGVAQADCDIHSAVAVFDGVGDAVGWALEKHGV